MHKCIAIHSNLETLNAESKTYDRRFDGISNSAETNKMPHGSKIKVSDGFCRMMPANVKII